jgi:hypothetical protein
MSEYNYVPAARRHYKDAETLREQGVRGNADHLYGIAAECALSAVVLQLGWAQLGSDGLEGEFRCHIKEQWNVMITRAKGRTGVAKLAKVLASNPFRDWHTRDRYSATGEADNKVVERHQKGADAMLCVMDAVRVGGQATP